MAADLARRPVPRTSPILLEKPRLIDQAARLRLDRAPGQIALIGLMIVAFAIVALSRLSGPPAGAGATPTLHPSASVAPASSGPVPSASQGAAGSPPASAASSVSPGPSARTTYTVKKGETLVGIAAKFKTTAAAIRKLNNLKSSTLRTGQVLKIP